MPIASKIDEFVIFRFIRLFGFNGCVLKFSDEFKLIPTAEDPLHFDLPAIFFFSSDGFGSKRSVGFRAFLRLMFYLSGKSNMEGYFSPPESKR
jgi:hypothetical protein